MTLEQAKQLKEMGFPQNGLTDTYYTWEGYKMFPVCVGVRPSTDKEKWDYCGNWYDNPTAEEALAWVEDKLYMPAKVSNAITVVQGVGWVNISVGIYGHVEKTPYFGKVFDTLSDAVYALIVWAHENKLLEA